jgi:hypothetical protein
MKQANVIDALSAQFDRTIATRKKELATLDALIDGLNEVKASMRECERHGLIPRRRPEGYLDAKRKIGLMLRVAKEVRKGLARRAR